MLKDITNLVSKTKHEKKVKCPKCSLTFRHQSQLKIHNRTHTNEKPFKCQQCDDGFNQH
eukprot:Pgem_evm1s7091